MALNIKSLSITAGFNRIKAYFQSQENNSKWKDLNTGSEGNFFMRMISTILHVISTRVVTGRREQFHDTANFLSSNIGLAVNNGYSVKRGYNQRRVISFIPNDNMTIPKFTPIGEYDDGDHFIYTLKDYTFVAGEPQELEVVVGLLKEITWKANTSGLKKFVRYEQGISEDYMLLLDGTEVPTTDIKKEQYTEDKYYIYTNPWKSVTIEYSNNSKNANHKYDTDSDFVLRYIELDNMDMKDFNKSMFVIGEVESTLVIETFVDFESVEEIKHNSPIYRETQNLVRSKADMADLVRNNASQIKETQFKPITPTYTAVCYRKQGNVLIEDYERENVISKLDPALAFGRPSPDITDPVREITTLDILLRVKNRYTDEASITADVNNIVNANYADILKGSFDIFDLEELIGQLSYVKSTRIELHIGKRTPYAKTFIGDLIEQGENIYKCTTITGISGQDEPYWNIPSELTSQVAMDTGLETKDYNLIWKCYKRPKSMEDITLWKANHSYGIGEWVYSERVPNYMFKCIDTNKYSGTTAPDTTEVEIGEYVEDGELMLVCIPYVSTYAERLDNNHYRLGDKFNIGSQSFQYVGQIGFTNSDDTLHFTDTVYELYVFPEEDKPNEDGFIYIDEEGAIDRLNVGNTLRVSTVENRETSWYEQKELKMGSKLNAEVKEYVDEDEPESEETQITGDVTSTYTINISEIPDGSELADKLEQYGEGDEIPLESALSGEGDGVTIEDEETPVTPPTKPSSNKPVQNANWKELEKVLADMDVIHEWIISEGNDRLRTPQDVLDFYFDISRISNLDKAKLEAYYDEYCAGDERQIYLHMDQWGTTRLEAIAELSKAEQLGEPIADSNSVKQYDEETGELVYVDKYRYLDVNRNYTIDRYDVNGVLRASRTYSADNKLVDEEIYGDYEKITNTYLATIDEIRNVRYNVGGLVKTITRIKPTVPVAEYLEGRINVSFSATDDGTVRWEQVYDTEKIFYDWFKFANFKVNLDIKY